LAGILESVVRRATRRHFLSTAIAGGAAVTLAGLAGSRAGGVSAQANDPLVGSWMTNYNRSTGEQLTGLLTFHENGTVVNSLSDHLTGTTSHGTWTSLGNNQYAYSVLRLDIDSTGNYAGIRAVDADVTVDPTGNSWTSASRTTFYDTSGNFMRMLTSTGMAKRIPVVRKNDPAPQSLGPAGSGQ
jgi:hypothetical protein